MKKLFTVLFFWVEVTIGQNAWINEFHYYKENEFIEISIEDTWVDYLDEFNVSLYNGKSGTCYATYNLSEKSGFYKGDADYDFTLFYKVFEKDQLQDDLPNGFALSYKDNLIQFISCGESFTASDGPAKGYTSTDIKIFEDGSTSDKGSLGLTGDGVTYESFSWVIFEEASPGKVNPEQTLPVELIKLSASTINGYVKLDWETATEVNNYGFEVQRRTLIEWRETQDWEKIGFVAGHGNSNSSKVYSYVDKTLNYSGKYLFRLKQSDTDGTFEYSDEIDVILDAPSSFELVQNYPNPFNPNTKISWQSPVGSWQTLRVYDVLGNEVAKLVDEYEPAGSYEVEFNPVSSIKNPASGVYFYQLKGGSFVQTKKMILMR